MIALACDGPFNGQYIDIATAAEAGYTDAAWNVGRPEVVWVLANIVAKQDRA